MTKPTQLTSYTSYAEIRAALGVSKTELPDNTLAQNIFFLQADMALDDLNPDLAAKFSEVSALPSPTVSQQRFLDLTKLFVTYAVSKELLTSLPLFSVKQLTDGKAEFVRQNDVYDDLREGVLAMYNNLKYRLSASYAGLVPGSAVLSRATPLFMSISTLGTDPVTG